MATFKRLEDLEVWQIARDLTREIYRLTRTDLFRRDYGLSNQIQRASVSVMSNIAEGFESETQAIFISYLNRAKASAGEIRCQLYIANDLGYITKDQFQKAFQVTESCSRQLYGFIHYLRSQPNLRRTS